MNSLRILYEVSVAICVK